MDWGILLPIDIKNIQKYFAKCQEIPQFLSLAYSEWIHQIDTIRFLEDTNVKELPIHLNLGYKSSTFMFPILVRIDDLDDNYIDDISKWNFSVPPGWGYGFHHQDGKMQKMIVEPLDHTGSNILDKGEAIVFHRDFRAGQDSMSYIEMNQKLIHLLDVHWIKKYNAYCRIDEMGDYEKVIRIDKVGNDSISVVRSKDLDFLMYLSDTVLVRVFDITRMSESFYHWNNTEIETIEISNIDELHGSLGIAYNDKKEPVASYLRGFQIIRRKSPEEEMNNLLCGKRNGKNYETFLAMDWKNKIICLCSCDPQKLGNYFVKSDLPFQTSPAFFNPEVLSKYKQDPDKYRIEPDTIHCRDAWSLRYSINDKNQVCAYLCDLGAIPFREQQYWKSFNEDPKNRLSRSTIKRDFLAEWDLPYDPLCSLKNALEEFPLAIQEGQKVVVWSYKGEFIRRRTSRLNYVLTESSKEWTDQILELNKLIIEGIEKKTIIRVAKNLNCHDSNLSSMKLLKKVLESQRLARDEINEIISPLFELNDLRIKFDVAHTGSRPPIDDLKLHYRDLIERIDRSMRRLSDLTRNGYFNFT